jgi:hypothetical protein
VFVIALAAADLLSLGTIDRIFGISPDNGLFPLAGVALVGIAATTLRWIGRQKSLGLVALLASIVLLEISVKPQRFGRQAWDESIRADINYGLPNYLRIREALQFLTDFRFPTRPVFWVSVENGTWETIALPRSYSYCIVEMHLPALDTEAADFQPGRYMVLAHPESNLVEQAGTELAKRHLRFDEISRKKIDYRNVSYYVVIGKLASVASQTE